MFAGFQNQTFSHFLTFSEPLPEKKLTARECHGKLRNLSMQRLISNTKLGDYHRRDIYERSTKKCFSYPRPAQRSANSLCARLDFLYSHATISRAMCRRSTYREYRTARSDIRHLGWSFGVDERRENWRCLPTCACSFSPWNRPAIGRNKNSSFALHLIATTICFFK